jgi:hypothetical protein
MMRFCLAEPAQAPKQIFQALKKQFPISASTRPGRVKSMAGEDAG